ncbi:MAG: hypothetical protein Q9184_004456 [Pyrenodesmia sp. 2 TL-2023]
MWIASEVIAAVGATYDIEPLFFATLIEDFVVRKDVRPVLELPKLCVQSVSWATMPRFLEIGRGYYAKVRPNATIDGRRTNLTVVVMVLPFLGNSYSQDVETSMYEDDRSYSEKATWDITHVYQTLQDWNPEEIHAASVTPMLYVFPLAYQPLGKLMSSCAEVGRQFQCWKKDDKAEKVVEGRERQLLHTTLIERIEWARTGLENLIQYTSLDEMKKMPGLPGRKAKAIATSFELAIGRACRKEQQIKDYLQMQVGVWSLEESRRSLEDGKRLKTRMDIFLHCSTPRD